MWVFFKFAGFGEILVISVVWLVLVIGCLLFCVFFWRGGFVLYGWCCFNELCLIVLLGWFWFLDL
jgi:hypothetical protein